MGNGEMNTGTQYAEETGRQGEKLFTQAEVDEIVSRRLARDRKKNETGAGQTADQNQTQEAPEREKDLNAREMKLMAKEKLFDSGLPLELADCLKFSDEESLDKAIETIKKIIQSEPKKKAWGASISGGNMTKEDPTRKAFGL